MHFSKQVQHACKWPRHASKAKSNRNKTQFLISGKHAGRLPGLGRGPTPPCRGVASMATIKEMRSEKSGFPSLKEHVEHEEQEHGEDECKIILCYYKIWDFMLWIQKHGPGYPYSRILREQTQNMNLKANFRIKQDFFFKNTWTLFSLSKTNFKSMHDMQNRFDHAIQLDDRWEQQE